MKGTGKIVLGIFSLAFFVVLYVRGQIALLHVSYQIEAKANKLSALFEESRRLHFEVDQLKAPRLLEEKMKQLSMDLTLPQEIRVVRIPLPKITEASLNQIPTQPFAGRVADFVGRWVGVAQAKTDN